MAVKKLLLPEHHELEEWTVDMDVTFKARGLAQAMNVAHILAEALETSGEDVSVYLGENYRQGDELIHRGYEKGGLP